MKASARWGALAAHTTAASPTTRDPTRWATATRVPGISRSISSAIRVISASAIEAYALIHGKPWGEWVVVIGTGSLLPFEVVSLVHHLRVERVLVLLINVVVLVYLIRLIAEQRRARHGAQGATGV